MRQFYLFMLLAGFILLAGCSTTNFPIGQSPPPGMNAAIQQEVIADAVEAAVNKLKIEPKASWESTAKVTITSPFSVYSSGGSGPDQGVIGYLKTMVEVALTKRGFHIVSTDTVNPDWVITIEVRTAGADVKEKDYVIFQENILQAVASCRVYIRKMSGGKKPNFVTEAKAVSDPYKWRHSILYIINLPDAKYRPYGEPSLWDKMFSLSRDANSGFGRVSQFQQTSFAR